MAQWLISSGFFVHAFDIALLADFDGAVAEDFDETGLLNHAAHALRCFNNRFLQAISNKGINHTAHSTTVLLDQFEFFEDARDLFVRTCSCPF